MAAPGREAWWKTLNIGESPEAGNAEAQPEREGRRDYQGASHRDDGIVQTARITLEGADNL